MSMPRGTIAEHHRLKMLELAIEGIEGLEIETIELERKAFLYLRHHALFCLMNAIQTQIITSSLADMVDYLQKWHRIDELVEIVQFVGVQRPRYKAGLLIR